MLMCRTVHWNGSMYQQVRRVAGTIEDRHPVDEPARPVDLVRVLPSLWCRGASIQGCHARPPDRPHRT